MACLVQNTTPPSAHLPVHENLNKKRKLASPNHFKNKRIQRIHDTSTSPPWTPLYGGLDQEAIQYIHKFYCKDCQMDQQAADRAKAAAAAASTGPIPGDEGPGGATVKQEVKQEPPSPVSPQLMDEGSIMIDKNKESLKRKLMMRRSLHELVDQGIYPSPKTPLAFMEQRKSLERAKIGDSLRFKISHRPDRQQLVQQHILEDTTIDPSLHERQRLLKKARLTDSLNDKLLHRPGVLELIQGNILQPDGTIQQLIKDGSISFDKTTEDDYFAQYVWEDSKSSDEAFSPDQTDDSNLSDISSPTIPMAPELPTSFAKSLPFSAQIQFSQESKVTLPTSSQPFTIPQQTSSVGGFSLPNSSVVTGSVLSPRSNVTVSTINNNNNNKARPKKPKPKPQPKAKVIKFHEYKGPPNVVKSTEPVSSNAAVVAAVNVVNPSSCQTHSTNNPDNTPYHILLQQQQLFLQWQLEFNQKNLNLPTTVIMPAQKEGQPNVSFASIGSMGVVGTSTIESAPVTVSTQSTPQTVFTVTPSSQQSQPPAQIQQIRISSPVMTQIKTEPQLGQPQPQLNPQIIPVNTTKSTVKKTVVQSPTGPPKQYSSLEEMKVAELKAELKKRNLTVSGPKPQLIERLKPYADAIIKNFSVKSPVSSVTSPGSSVLSPTSSVLSSKTGTSPLPVLSPQSAVMSPQGSATSSKTMVISPPGSALSSSPFMSTMTLPVSVVSNSGIPFTPQGSSQSILGTLTSPSSIYSSSGSITSPSGSIISQPASVLSRPGSVMSPLGSVIDETLSTNAVSPLPSIQSMQSAVSVSNVNIMPDELSNPFSPPPSPIFIDSGISPLSPDIMEIPIQSPPDLTASLNAAQLDMKMGLKSTAEIGEPQTLTSSAAMEHSRPPSVLSLAPSEPDKPELAPMDVDFELSQSFGNSGLFTGQMTSSSIPSIQHSSHSVQAPPPPPPLPAYSNKFNIMNSPKLAEQQQLLQQIQSQLQVLQQKQQQQSVNQHQMSTQISNEELMKQQQEKIEKLQTQLEESQLRLQLQQLQHQQMQHQQHQLQQQAQHLKQQQQIAAQQQQHQHEQQQQQQQQQTQQLHQQQQQPKQQLQHRTQQVAQQHQQQPQLGHSYHQQQGVKLATTSIAMSSQSSVQPLQVHTHSSTMHSVASHGQPAVMMNSTAPTGQPPVATMHNPVSSQQVIFSMPSVPNGGKAPSLANLPPNMKQIQIPANLLHAVQTSQGLPAVIVTQNPKATSNKGKTPSLEFLKNQAFNQTLNLSGGKSLITVSSGPGGVQQFIITTAVAQPKPATTTVNINGLTQPTVPKMASSLPTSPVERPVTRTASNPFFIPLKEPPRYDEAVKNKQNKLPAETSTNHSSIKSQTMDDVLEILIRTGELPASAAEEPFPAAKTTSQSATVPTISISQSDGLGASQATNQGHTAHGQYSAAAAAVTFSTPVTMTHGNHGNQGVVMDNSNKNACGPIAGSLIMSAASGDTVEIKSEMQTATSGYVPANMSENSNDFFDLNDVINTDLNSMDWTSDPAFCDLDLTDTACINSAMDLMPTDNSLLSMPLATSPQRSNHGSEPDLANLGLTDMDTNSNMQIDVPDWLDVIMPSTGLTPLSANAPVSFPADPILTPRTHQEVLDLFAFEDDLNTPSDLSGGTNWDKLTGKTSS